MAFPTTGDFTSAQLAEQARELELPAFDVSEALNVGEIALSIAHQRTLRITIEIWVGDRLIFKAALPGTSEENDDWLRRKHNVVKQFDESTLAVRVRHEELSQDFYETTGLPEVDFAAHGGGWPIKVTGRGTVGFMGISGLPQVDDHKLIVECLHEFLRNPTPSP